MREQISFFCRHAMEFTNYSNCGKHGEQKHERFNRVTISSRVRDVINQGKYHNRNRQRYSAPSFTSKTENATNPSQDAERQPYPHAGVTPEMEKAVPAFA